MRAAQRAAVRLARAKGEQAEFQPEHRQFPCAYVCSDCGQLHPPSDPTAGHPTRRIADADARPEAPCSHCGSNGWIDLANVAMADLLRDSERARDQERPINLLVPLGLGLLGAMATANAGFSAGRSVAWPMSGGPVIPLWLLVALVIFGAALASRLWQRRRPRRKLPHRWSLSPTQSSGPRTSGRAQCRQTLRAPLTGRPCVAYELAIQTADEPKAALGRFALVEQRCADLEVGGVPFRGCGVRLALRRERVELDPTDDEHRKAMHIRGLEPVGDAFTVYETIIAPEALVEVSGIEAAATLRTAA